MATIAEGLLLCASVLCASALLPLQRPLQVNHLRPHVFHARVEPQSAAKGIESCHRVLLQLIRLPHDRGGQEVVGVDLQGLMAILDGGVVLLPLEKRLATVVPSLGNPRGVFDQRRGELRRAVEFSLVEMFVDGDQMSLLAWRLLKVYS